MTYSAAAFLLSHVKLSEAGAGSGSAVRLGTSCFESFGEPVFSNRPFRSLQGVPLPESVECTHGQGPVLTLPQYRGAEPRKFEMK